MRLHLGWGRILDLSGAQPAPRCWFVGEGVPLALDARTVCVEGLADADYVQARLVRQLLHQCRDLLDRLAVDALLTHSPVNWTKEGGNKRKRAGQVSDEGKEVGRATPGVNPPVPARPCSRYSATTLGTQHGRGFTYITTPGFRRVKLATSRSTNSLKDPRRVSTVTPDPGRPLPGVTPPRLSPGSPGAAG